MLHRSSDPRTQMTQQIGDLLSPRARLKRLHEAGFTHRAVQPIGIGAREPVGCLPEQAVTRPGIPLHSPSFHQAVQPEQQGQIDVAWSLVPAG